MIIALAGNKCDIPENVGSIIICHSALSIERGSYRISSRICSGGGYHLLWGFGTMYILWLFTVRQKQNKILILCLKLLLVAFLELTPPLLLRLQQWIRLLILQLLKKRRDVVKTKCWLKGQWLIAANVFALVFVEKETMNVDPFQLGFWTGQLKSILTYLFMIIMAQTNFRVPTKTP